MKSKFKRIKIFLTFILMLSLFSCDFQIKITNNSSSNSVESNTSSSLVISNENESSSSESSFSSEDKSNLNVDLDFYCINDFHGRIEENVEKSEPGIAKLASYLDIKKSENPNGYVFLNSGDLWQDTYDSMMNKGALLTEAMNAMECEAISLGNHEFDWGIDTIKENAKISPYTKFLGANIYEYPNTEIKSDWCDSYKIIERQGLKIGIIGGIGKDQITSITSSIWEDLTFLNPTTVIQSISNELRSEKGCDIIALIMHTDAASSDRKNITSISPLTNKRYVDLVFNAHTHQQEVALYNGVPFVQSGSHGVAVSHIKINYSNGDIVSTYYGIDGEGEMNVLAPNQNIEAIVNKYLTEDFIAEKNEVVGTISNLSYISKNLAGRLLAKATYELIKDNYEVDIIINNGARDNVDAGLMTKEKVFNMVPFTNKTYIVSKISGADILAECVNYSNPYYWVNPNLKLSENNYYTVASIDYILLHKNSSRNYNYFPSYSNKNVIEIIDTYSVDIVCSYLKQINTFDGYTLINDTNYTCLAS